MSDSLEKLRSLHFFTGLTTDQLKIVEAACENKNFEASSIVIKEGDTPDGMYVILAGSASVIKNGQTISQLKENDFFGELALLAIAKPRNATIIADQTLETLFLPASAFNNIKLGLSTDVFDEIVKRIDGNL